MSDTNHAEQPSDPPLASLAEAWTRLVLGATETSAKALGNLPGSADQAAWRRQWFQALEQQSEAFLRTPQFLAAMKSQIDALTAAKQRASNTTANSDARAEPAGGSDAELRSRLLHLERRVEALENIAGAGNGAAGWEQFLRAAMPAETSPDRPLGVTPHDVVYEEGTLRLVRYRNAAVRYAEPVLICFALVNRPYVLDLQDDRSVVRQLLAGGLDVYLIDWGVPRSADHTLRLHDYVGRLLKNAVDFVCTTRQTPHLNLLGYCMGGTLSAMFTALFPERVRNLILLAAPIDFSDDEGLLNLWAREDYFNVDKLIDAYGNCPGEFLRHCFQLMKPVQNTAEKYLLLCEKLTDSAFLENFFALERWANDSIPVAGETFREFVRLLYQQNQLVKGELFLGGQRVRLAEIACPLLLLTADQDHLVRPQATLAIQPHVRSREVRTMSIGAGHIGLAVSSKAHHQLWPSAAAWIGEHSTLRAC